MTSYSLQLSSDAAVKQILAGERADKGKPPSSKSQDKESKDSKTEEQKSHRDKEVGICNFCGVQGLPLFVLCLLGCVFSVRILLHKVAE